MSDIMKGAEKMDAAIDKMKSAVGVVQDKIQEKISKIQRLKRWFMALPKWKKAVYGILLGIVFLIPFSLVLVVFFLVDFKKPSTIIPDKNDPPVTIKPNPAGTDVMDPALANSVSGKLNDIGKDLGK